MIDRLFKNQTTRQTILKNTFWLFFAQAISRVLRFGVIFVAARILGPAGYGSFSYALSAATIAFVLADWGVDLLVVREFARHEHKIRFLRSALSLKLVLLAVFSTIASIGYLVIDEPGAKSVYLFLVLLMVVTQMRDFFIYVLRAQEKMEREFALIVTESVGTLALVALFLWSTPSIPMLGLAYVVGMTLSLICGAWLGRKVFAGSFLGWDSKIVTWLLTNGWSLAIFGVLTSVFFSTDQIMLGRVRSPMEVGLYAVAAKVITLALVVPQVMMVALFPYLMRVAGSRRSRDVAIAMTGLLALFGVAVGCLTYILAPWLIAILGGPEYAQAVPILRNLIWIVVMIFPVTFLDYFLIANGKQVADLVVTGIAAVANVAFAFWLIPLYGVSGAVWATAAGQTLNVLLTAGVALKLFLRPGALDGEIATVREEPPTI